MNRVGATLLRLLAHWVALILRLVLPGALGLTALLAVAVAAREAPAAWWPVVLAPALVLLALMLATDAQPAHGRPRPLWGLTAVLGALVALAAAVTTALGDQAVAALLGGAITGVALALLTCRPWRLGGGTPRGAWAGAAGTLVGRPGEGDPAGRLSRAVVRGVVPGVVLALGAGLFALVPGVLGPQPEVRLGHVAVALGLIDGPPPGVPQGIYTWHAWMPLLRRAAAAATTAVTALAGGLWVALVLAWIATVSGTAPGRLPPLSRLSDPGAHLSGIFD